MSRTRAETISKRCPIGSTWAQEWRRCACAKCKRDPKWKGHGPYWMLRTYVDGRPKRVHVGNDEARAEVELAWAMLRAEHARLGKIQHERMLAVQRTPEGQRMRSIEALFVDAQRPPGQRRAPRVAVVPILGTRRASPRKPPPPRPEGGDGEQGPP